MMPAFHGTVSDNDHLYIQESNKRDMKSTQLGRFYWL